MDRQEHVSAERAQRATPGGRGPEAGFVPRETLLWMLFLGSLIGAVVTGSTVKYHSAGHMAPYQGLSAALGLVAAASLVMACLERRPKA